MYKLISGIITTTVIVLLSFSASAQICPASVVTGTGIGDGCTTSYEVTNNDLIVNKVYDLQNLANIPQIGVFRSTFTTACNNHDKCLVTLGSL